MTCINACCRPLLLPSAGSGCDCAIARPAAPGRRFLRWGLAARLRAAGASVPVMLALAGWAAEGRGQAPEHPPVTVHVVSHGWHSGIVVPAALAQAHGWPAARDFPQAAYFEVGWGDRSYYQSPDPGWWTGLLALLWPRPGVLHVVALAAPAPVSFPASPIIALPLSHEGAQRLGAAVAASHARDGDGAALAFGPSLYGQGRFYASVERFHLLATCNVWVARRLRDGGLALQPALALSSRSLFRQLQAQLPPPPAPGASALATSRFAN